jgi:hypothetical protein
MRFTELNLPRTVAFLSWISFSALAFSQAATPDDWKRVEAVLTHPRCLNCHTAVDHPKQGDDRHRHLQYVLRAADGRGAPGMRCATCHRDANNAASGVPGAPNWHLAPLSMSWENKDGAALCRALLDRKRNGNRSVGELVQHVANDALVDWAWAPGADRNPVPIPKQEFIALLKRWADAGAPCAKEGGAANLRGLR